MSEQRETDSSKMLGPFKLGPSNDGNNGIYVSDVLDFLSNLPHKSVPLFFFSPPYNLGTTTGGGFPQGHYKPGAPLGRRGGGGKWNGGNLAQGYDKNTDAMPPEEYKEWQKDILMACWEALSDDGAIYYQHKPRILGGLLQTPLDFNPGLPVRQIVIWARAGGMNFSPTYYCPTHEWIVIFAKPDFRLKSKAASGVGDVWYIPQENNTWHPAPFPLSLALQVIETVMPSLIVDPFVGRGTTAAAAKQLNVPYLCNDISREYVEKAREWIESINPLPGLVVKQIELNLS